MSKLDSNRYSDAGSVIQEICVLYLIVWGVSPPLSIGTIYRLAALGAAAGWFAIELLRHARFSINDVKGVIFVIAIMLIAFIEYGDFSHIMKNIALFMAVICYIIQGHYDDRWRELHNLIPIVFVLLIFFNIRTFTTLLADPTIARKIVRNDNEMIPYLNQGVGGYALIYMQVCLVPAFTQYLIKSIKINRFFFLISAAWLVTFILVIANAGYSLAIFTTVSSVFILLFYKGKRVVPAVIVMLMIFVGAMFALIYLEGLRNSLLTFFDGTAVAKKINDLLATNETGTAEGSIYVRVEAYRQSLNAIYKYPFIGSLWFASNSGGHSALLDIFAKYGFLCGIFYLKLLFGNLFHFKQKYYFSNTVNSVTNASFAAILFVSILDSFSYEIYPLILILLYVVIHSTYEWEYISNEINKGPMDS